jgi:hypothetical protein
MPSNLWHGTYHGSFTRCSRKLLRPLYFDSSESNKSRQIGGSGHVVTCFTCLMVLSEDGMLFEWLCVVSNEETSLL